MCLGLGILGLLGSMLSIVHLLLASDDSRGTLQGLLGVVPMPPQFAWMVKDTLGLTLANTGLSFLFVCVGWGLWCHREWARRGIMALLLTLALMNFAALLLIGPLFDQVMTLLPSEMITAPDITPLLHTARFTVLGLAVFVAIAVAALHGWLIWRFQAPEIRAQFH